MSNTPNAGTVADLLLREGHAGSEYAARHTFLTWWRRVEVNGEPVYDACRILRRGDVVTVRRQGVHTYTV